MYNALPQTYRETPLEQLKERISAARERHGERLVILCHHYQRLEVVAFGDYLGDSYLLAKTAQELTEAETIVFCGVHFMAESADILAGPGQTVFLPNPLAGCPMADMAEIPDVLAAWEELKDFGGAERITPLSYMNSAAALKSFCGENGGLICTSSNAEQTLAWAWGRREKVFFFPDRHLGYNTARQMGIRDEQTVLWDFSKPLGGLSAEEIERAKIILWKGHCHVHTNFTGDQVVQMREKYPGVKIVAHPECPWEVVEKADAVGSTNFIVDYCAKQPPGSIIAIGTEINLINRLAHTYPDKRIIELSGSTCPVCANMYRTTLNDLAHCLENYPDLKPIKVSERIKKNARVALQRMIDVTSGAPVTGD
ncbi:MAG: quinolinate synthase NadA [Candidatus Zixiibacteriota bacterium]